MVSEPIDSLPRTHQVTIRRLASLGIKTYWDMLNYFPTRHEDYSLISSIARIQEGEIVTIRGKVLDAKNEYRRRRFTIQKVTLADDTGKIILTWFNQPYLITLFKKGVQLQVAGPVKKFGSTLTVESREYELLTNGQPIHTGRIVPIYPEKRGLSSRTIREKMQYVLRNVVLNDSEGSLANASLPTSGEILLRQLADQNGSNLLEFLPKDLIIQNKLINEIDAYLNIHFPINKDFAGKARERLAFDELFLIQLASWLTKKAWQKDVVRHPLEVKKHMGKVETFIENLPFELTNSQKKVVDEILADLEKPTPMNRFLQGDVGSGKTVVAAIAAYVTHLNGYQTLLMAPTEILATQHFETITKLFKNTLTIGLHTSSTKLKEPFEKFDLVIGTHALLGEKVTVANVSLIVIDEQHRFGVKQRALLKQKGAKPHLLTMTATPIPRTVALTLYGELDMSVISEMPKGRIPVKTYLVPKHKRGDAYSWIREKIAKEKTQVFIICPLIEESEVETMKSVRAAKKEYELLTNDIFPDLTLELLHGKMKSREKDEAMKKFKERTCDILVSTSVVEVGIDIPNATIMVIEGAQRYGLAQLHQLRGRVGRSDKQSYCLLFTDSNDKKVTHRLQFFATTQKGIALAEYDLQHRGPGEMYGVRQHGLDDLKIASLTDLALVKKVSDATAYFLAHSSVDSHPRLKERIELYRSPHLIAQD